jgi:hypothetical protein
MPVSENDGVGLQVRAVDSSGTRLNVCDGAEPGSAVLSDGSAACTPGISERREGVSKEYHGAALGSTLDQGGVRLLVCCLPMKSPWLNNIEPKWVHGKRATLEPERKLAVKALKQRLCDYYQCERMQPWQPSPRLHVHASWGALATGNRYRADPEGADSWRDKVHFRLVVTPMCPCGWTLSLAQRS